MAAIRCPIGSADVNRQRQPGLAVSKLLMMEVRMIGKQKGGPNGRSIIWGPEFFSRALLLCMILLLVVGCGSLEEGQDGKHLKTKDIPKTPTEEKKAKLLKRINRDFEDAKAHFELGRLYQAEGMWTQAEREYSTALGFDPVHRGAQASRVKVLLNSSDTAQAQVSAEFYMNQASSSAVGSLQLAERFKEQGLDEYAMSCYRQALNLAPNSAKVNRQIGYYYLSKGNKPQAKDYLSRSFQINPNQPEVAMVLGRLGIEVRVPRKTQKNARKVDRVIK